MSRLVIFVSLAVIFLDVVFSLIKNAMVPTRQIDRQVFQENWATDPTIAAHKARPVPRWSEIFVEILKRWEKRA
jgi:hypothetical protein